MEAFFGGFLWIRRTAIAVPEMDGIARRGLERCRLGYGESRALETASAHLFRNDESAEFAAVLLIVLLAEWDAYVVHHSGE